MSVKISEIPSALRPPLLRIPKSMSADYMQNLLDRAGLSKNRSVTKLFDLMWYCNKVDVEGYFYVSMVDIEELANRSRSWKNTVSKKIIDHGLFGREYYLRAGAKGALSSVYVLSVDVERMSASKGKNESLMLASVDFENNLGIEVTSNYIENRPATLFDLVSKIMACLPTKLKFTGTYYAVSIMDGTEIVTKARALSDELLANDTDIRALVVLCTLVEDAICNAARHGVDLDFSDFFDVQVSTLVKIIYGNSASGSGYNNAVIDAMKRLSWTQIEPVTIDDGGMDRWGRYFDKDLRNEPTLRALTVADPYFRKGSKKQRIKFMLHPTILKILKKIAQSSMNGKILNTTSLISNQVAAQNDRELMRLDIFCYGKLLGSGIAAQLSWDELIKLRKPEGFNYVDLLTKKIRKAGICIDVSEDTYELDGLRIKIAEDGIVFCAICGQDILIRRKETAMASYKIKQIKAGS